MTVRGSDGEGVGRGYGPGSARTQFKSGMPSGNPNGRPRKPKPESNASLAEAAHGELNALIEITENGVKKIVPQPEAMMRTLTARFPKAGVKDQIAIIRFFLELVPTALQERDPMPSPDAIREFIEKLAEESRKHQNLDLRYRR